MLKLFIVSLLILLSVKSFSFENVDTGTYKSAKLIEVDIQDCMEEIEYQYTDLKGSVDYTDISLKDINLMEDECIKENLKK